MSYRLKVAIAVAMATVATPAFAQDSATADSSVQIIVPVQISKDDDLDFGTVARPIDGSGTVTVDATTGEISVDGGVVAVSGTPTRALFTVTGDNSRAYFADIPESFSLSDGGTTPQLITVTLTSDLGTPGDAVAGTLSSTGSQEIGIGGSFTITDATPAAAYTGSFTVSVAYN